MRGARGRETGAYPGGTRGLRAHAQRKRPVPQQIYDGLLPVVSLDLDVSAIARLPQPVLKHLVGLALAQRHARLIAPPLGGDVLRAAPGHLDDVPAEVRAHGLRDLVDLE